MFAQGIGPITDFAAALGTMEIRILAILIAVDVILGVGAAIASKKFNFNLIATFMATGVLPYLFGFAVVELIAPSFGSYSQIVLIVVFVVIVLKLIGSIISNLANLGVNMPSIFKRIT